MRDNTVIQVQFSRAASGAKNKTDIINALNELETAEGLKIVDYVVAFCQECGIDPEELGDYYNHSSEYLAKKQAEDDKHEKDAALKAIAEKTGEYQAYLTTYQDYLTKGHTPTHEEMQNMQKKGEEIGREAAVLSADTSTNKKPFMTFEDYVSRRIDYNIWEEYAPDLFHKLPFPNGTINLIGARSGGGKTASLINLARDIITTAVPQKIESSADKEKERNKRRRVVFICREMMIEAIYERLVLSVAWDYTKNDRLNTLNLKKEDLELLTHPTQTIWDTLRTKRHTDPVFKPMERLYNLVLDTYINPAIKSEKLLLYNALDEISLENILTNLKAKTEAGDIILVDYVQILPPSTTADAEKYAIADYLRARYIVTAIKKYAAENNVVFICAAQISTTAAKSQTKGETSTEADFKDSSDFGQAAHSAVILTREKTSKDEPPRLFYKCVKARSSHHLNDEYNIEWVPKYQYMGPGGGRQSDKGNGPNPSQKNKPSPEEEKIRDLAVLEGLTGRKYGN